MMAKHQKSNICVSNGPVGVGIFENHKTILVAGSFCLAR